MKDSKFRYYLCYYSHLCFFYSFWGYFFYINYFASSWHGNECVFGLLILSVIWIMGRKCYCIICN